MNPTPGTSAPRSRQEPPRETTYIGPGLKISGEITGRNDLYVEGVIEGKIALESGVVIGEKGSVSGEIRAKVVKIAGKVDGNIFAGGTVEIQPTGSLVGDLAAPGLEIAAGGFFKGSVEMTGRESEKPEAKSS